MLREDRMPWLFLRYIRGIRVVRSVLRQRVCLGPILFSLSNAVPPDDQHQEMSSSS